jgi:hypothetical protein
MQDHVELDLRALHIIAYDVTWRQEMVHMISYDIMWRYAYLA